MAMREAKCSRLRRSRAGHELFAHRHTTSSSGPARSRLSQRGHVSGMTHGVASAGRSASTGPITRGITSPAFSMVTVSRSRMSLREMSSALCSVAIEMVDPATSTGSSTAYGVAAPVRPMFTRISLSRVVACWAGNLKAMAHRGNLAVVPRATRCETVDLHDDPVGLERQRVAAPPASARRTPTTASIPSQRSQCGSTATPMRRISRAARHAWPARRPRSGDQLVHPGAPAATLAAARGSASAHGARRGVARIREQRLACRFLLARSCARTRHAAGTPRRALRGGPPAPSPQREGQRRGSSRTFERHVFAADAVASRRAARRAGRPRR